MPATKTKPTKKTAKPVSTTGELPEGEIRELDVQLIDLHAAYGEPDEAEVKARMESLAGPEGQITPVEVRPKGDGKRFELVAGRHNFLAVERLKWPKIRANVRPLTDEQALRLFVASDSQRREVSPIEKAERAELVCRPVAEGGLGYTRQQAAELLKLETHSAVSNLISLLKLPAEWRERIASGALPESWGRVLVKLCEAPRLLAMLDEQWKDAAKEMKQAGATCLWSSRNRVEEAVERVLVQHTRPIDRRRKHYYHYQQIGHYGEFPRLFEVTDENRERLGIATLEIDGQAMEVATNAEYYDELNIPLIREQLASEQEEAVEEDAKEVKKTKAVSEELAADVREREAEDRLEKRIAAWRLAWFQQLVARELAATKEATAAAGKKAKRGKGAEEDRRREAAMAALVWLSIHPLSNFATQNAAELDAQLSASIGGGKGLSNWELIEGAIAKGRVTWETLGVYLAKVIVCPPTKSGLTVIPAEVIEGLARMLRIDLVDEWRRDQLEGGKKALAAFAGLHQSEQLIALGGELGVYLEEAKTRDAKLAVLTGVSRALPFPAALQEAKRGKRKKK